MPGSVHRNGTGPVIEAMKFTVTAVLVAVATLSMSAAKGSDFPRLNTPSMRQECQEALKVAQTLFRSDSRYLYAPSPIPPEVKSRLVLQPQWLDISGGDALLADPLVFDKRRDPVEEASRSFYWQRGTQWGYRLVLKETSRGWQGDTYSVFAVPEGMPLEELATRVPYMAPKNEAMPAALEDSWRPPLIFSRNGSGHLWLIDVGQPHTVLGRWSVQSADPQTIQTLCTIQFSAEMLHGPIALLPAQVQNFERLLDRALGSGLDEGTAQPTAQIRLNVRHTWANVALRPWAESHPYNTRAEIDEGLAKWAGGSASNAALLRRLQLAYLPAERSLASHYQKNFHLSANESNEQAVYEIDIAYREHFSFEVHRGDLDEHAQAANPWRWK